MSSAGSAVGLRPARTSPPSSAMVATAEGSTRAASRRSFSTLSGHTHCADPGSAAASTALRYSPLRVTSRAASRHLAHDSPTSGHFKWYRLQVKHPLRERLSPFRIVFDPAGAAADEVGRISTASASKAKLLAGRER